MSELKEVDPTDLAVDSMNERTEVSIGGDFEQSIKRVGVLEPLIVRECDEGYNVVIGQRRMLAAQNVGVDTVPVVVVEWDDADALEASIVENIDVFRQDIAKKDRAAAVSHLKSMHGWTQSDVAKHLNVGDSTVSDWLEYTKEAWEGTIIHVEYERNNDPDVRNNNVKENDVEKISTDIIVTIRQCMNGSDEGIEALNVVVSEGLSVADIREAKQNYDDSNGYFIDELQRVADEKHDDLSNDDTEQEDDTEQQRDTTDDSTDDVSDTSDDDNKSTETETEDTESDSEDTTTDDVTEQEQTGESGSDDDGDTDDSDTDSEPETTDDSMDEGDTNKIEPEEITMKFQGQGAEDLRQAASANECKTNRWAMDKVNEALQNEGWSE